MRCSVLSFPGLSHPAGKLNSWEPADNIVKNQVLMLFQLIDNSHLSVTSQFVFPRNEGDFNTFTNKNLVKKIT